MDFFLLSKWNWISEGIFDVMQLRELKNYKSRFRVSNDFRLWNDQKNVLHRIDDIDGLGMVEISMEKIKNTHPIVADLVDDVVNFTKVEFSIAANMTCEKCPKKCEDEVALTTWMPERREREVHVRLRSMKCEKHEHSSSIN